MLKTKKVLRLVICTSIALLLIIFIGPMDIFSHGFFSNEIDCSQIAENDWLENISLEDDEYEMIFSPQKKHFAGFSIYLLNQPEENTGNIIMTIMNDSGKILDEIVIDLSKVHEATWYKVYTHASLKKNSNYTLRFMANNCVTIPYLQNVDRDYLSQETVTGNILISYAYKESTFTFQNKVIISLFIIAMWLFFCGLFTTGKIKRCSMIASGMILMISVMTWNFMYNSMDNQNSSFSWFQEDSESLVTGVIYAEQDGEYYRNRNEIGFGLGRYYDLKGCLMSHGNAYISDGNWLNGYSRSEAAIVVNSNIYSREVAAVGNYILFSNGEKYQITSIEDNGTNIVVYLDSGKVLTEAKNGSLDDAEFYDKNNVKLAHSIITAYKSQYGLHGKIFKRMAIYMDEKQIVANLYLVCSIAAAIIFTVIVMLVAAKYNAILGGCFFVTFWLSPWIVNFARNLYWIEFTWFIPMAIGLFCAWKIDNRKCRIISYVMAFLAIMVKCLCGYEYISVIMMGLISFLLVDLVVAISNKDRSKLIILLRSITITGVAAIIGFMTAICIHAPLYGDGNIMEGIKIIFENDVLRRTNGANLNDFNKVYWASMNASVWEVFCKYFHFSTEIITGISRNLFPALCIIPLGLFGYEYKMKKLNIELLAMYVVFFLTSISWFCLAKSHSYIHDHINYVLWYFGYVQICLYIIVNKIVSVIKKKDIKVIEGK